MIHISMYDVSPEEKKDFKEVCSLDTPKNGCDPKVHISALFCPFIFF
jgi:hypothetical protein